MSSWSAQKLVCRARADTPSGFLRSQPTLLGDTLSAILATLVGAGALVLAGHILAASDADNFKIVGGVVGSSIPLSGLWFFASGGSGAKKKSR